MFDFLLGLFVCMFVCLYVCMSVSPSLPLVRFGQLILCANKGIVNLMKVEMDVQSDKEGHDPKLTH